MHKVIIAAIIAGIGIVGLIYYLNTQTGAPDVRYAYRNVGGQSILSQVGGIGTGTKQQ